MRPVVVTHGASGGGARQQLSDRPSQQKPSIFYPVMMMTTMTATMTTIEEITYTVLYVQVMRVKVEQRNVQETKHFRKSFFF